MGQKNQEIGRGTFSNPDNSYLKQGLVTEHVEGLDEEYLPEENKTAYIEVFPRTILNKVDSPDIGMTYSMNPYQGCEHGCTYCYARNSHQYWGYSAGLDFEQKILVKPSAPILLEEKIKSKQWKAVPIMLSGNTDCYQPIERKLEITRMILKVLLRNHHPAGIITKNSLILRDMDILSEMAQRNLVVVSMTITSLNEGLRRKLEPRTSSYQKRIDTVRKLSEAGIPVNIMMAPIIPGLNSHEIYDLAQKTADAGALSFNYTILRLNGHLDQLFTEWVNAHYPDRAQKILNQVRDCHGGSLSDSRFGTRMRGEGVVAKQIKNMVQSAKMKYLKDRSISPLDCETHNRRKNGQLDLFSVE